VGIELKAIIIGSDVEITPKSDLLVEMYIQVEACLHKLIEAKHKPEGSLKSL